MTSGELSQALAAHGVYINGVTPATMRIVTHYDVDRAGCERALQVMERVLQNVSVSR
jgi:hypothetical protein